MMKVVQVNHINHDTGDHSVKMYTLDDQGYQKVLVHLERLCEEFHAFKMEDYVSREGK